MNVWETEKAKKRISLYGSHDMRVIVYGNIGFLKYCRLCGTGEWASKKDQPSIENSIENGVHYKIKRGCGWND